MHNDNKEKDPQERKLLPKAILFAALSWIACSIDLGIKDNTDAVTNLLDSLGSFRFERFPLFLGLFFLYLAIGKKRVQTPGPKKTPGFLSLLFAFFMLFGRAFEKWNTYDPLLGIRNGQIVKSILFFSGYAVLFCYLIWFLFDLLDQISAGSVTETVSGKKWPKLFGWYAQVLKNRPFLTVFLTLLIFSVPNLIMSYPARFMGDTNAQIVQAYDDLRTTGFWYLDAGSRWLKDGVYINQHHPVAHTLLLHVFLLLGDAVAGSLNHGVFLYVLFQTAVLSAAFAYACSVMIRKTGLSSAGALLTILYAAFHPMIVNYTCLVTKDTVYAALILICLSNVFRLLSGESSRRLLLLTILSMFGIVLFRNEGRYVLYLFLVLMLLLCKETRRCFISVLIAVAIFSAGVFRLLYPTLGFTPGSVREVLSVPFQQTARYVRDYPDQVTEQEREAIDRILDYDNLSSLYTPGDKSDPVKATFREESTGEDLKNYFQAWAQMLRKHPFTYLQAAMNDYYQFFYPAKARMWFYQAESTRYYVDQINPLLNRIGKNFSLPENLAWMRDRYDDDLKLMKKLPVIDVLITPAYYSWILILLLFWTISRKKRKAICLVLLPLILLAFNLAGPCNGYYSRYLFPVISAMPIIIRMTTRLSELSDDPARPGAKASTGVRP